MLPLIGLIIAAYAVTRLLQVPIEHSDSPSRWVILLLISIGGILGILALAGMLFLSGVDTAIKTVR